MNIGSKSLEINFLAIVKKSKEGKIEESK